MALPDHWTSAILVPNSLAKRTAQNYGFPAGNIAIWDADSQEGVEEAIGTVRAAATSFLIRPFVDSHPGVTYERGACYYQLGSLVQVQPDKEVVVVEKDTDRADTGDAARSLLFGTGVRGTVSVKAGNNPKLEVYVQSRSVNRKLKPKTRLLIML